MEDLKLNAPPENALVKETLSIVGGSPKKGIFKDHPLKLRQKRSSLTGKIRVGMEKDLCMQTIEASKDKKSKKAKLIEELTPEDGSEYDICMQTIEASKDKKSKKAKLIEELTPENGSEYDICMQNTWNPNCVYKENIALKKNVETNSTKEENKEF